MMNRKVGITLIVIWSVIAVVFAGLLKIFIKGSGIADLQSLFHTHFTGSTVYADKSFKTRDVQNINLKVSYADVYIKLTDSDSIKVKITGNGNKSRKKLYTVNRSGQTINVVQNNSINFIHLFNFGMFNQKVVIEMPRSYSNNLSAMLASGDINMDGSFSLSDVNIESASGNIKTGKIEASQIKIKSSSGDINLGGIEGAYDIHATSGDIKVDDLVGSGEIRAISGNVYCKVTKLNGNLNLSAVSGDISVGIEKSVSASIKANTLSGDINSDFPMYYSGHGRKNGNGSAGSGGKNTISVSQTSGDANFRSI